MKKIELFFLFTVILLSSMLSSANPVSREVAQKVAANFWTAVKGGDDVMLRDISLQYGFQEFYLFVNTYGAGFVVVSADDCVQPILGYSTTTSVPKVALPEPVQEFLLRYEQEILYHKEHHAAATETIVQQWTSLRQGRYMPQNTTAVSPLLTTTWDQIYPYNNLCPDSAGYRAPTGCVATAMAQVMKYWEWPTQGIGSYSYTDDNFGPISANFGATTYQWSQMPDVLDSSSSQEQINAVATLLFHAGVAVKMNYGINSSFALLISALSNTPSCANALTTYFGYKNTLQCVYKSQTSDIDWISTLTNEINAGRPVLERGSGNGTGHLFVCDGYDNNGLFHINWGWGSYCDGYFAHNALNPNGGGTGSSENNSYNDNVAILIGVEPAGGNPNVQYNITVNASDNAMGTATGGGVYAGSSMVELWANANAGYRFTGWNDGVTDNPRNIIVSEDITYTANFADLGDDVRHYDNGIYNSAWTVDNQTEWGIRFPSGTLSPYTTLTALRLFDVAAGNYSIHIYQGNIPNSNTMVANKNFQLSGSHSWQEISLDAPITLNHSKILWAFINYDGSEPAAALSTYAGNTDGSWLLYGGHPYTTTTFSDYLTWMIRVVLDDPDAFAEHTDSDVNIYSVGGSIVAQGAENTWVKIYDLAGRLLINEWVDTEHKVFHVAANGLYLVQTGHGLTRKVMVFGN